MADGIELGKAYVQIVPSAKGIKDSIVEELGGESARAGESAGQLFTGKLVGTIKTVLGTAAIGKMISDSVNAGGALQQSLGGIETLFKDSADKVKTYAAQAYKTAGLSANDYMESTTSFAASLLSSVSQDTDAAAQLANMAMVDMSDNANKMGTSMQDIQNAYQGFAKQNYTMLDNLKLGYGGTQAEMQRLLKDAEKISGVKYDLGNLADMYSAIHVIQTELDITGTTAREATTTLTGSFASMKAAAQNVLGQMALGEDLQPSLEALVETARTYLVDNLLPLVVNAVGGIPEAIAALAPAILQTGTELLQNLTSGFATGIPDFLSQALPAVLSFTEELRANFGDFVSAGIDLILSLANGLVEGLPQLFAYIPDIVINIAGLINDNAPKILAGAVGLMVQLGKGLIDSIPLIIQNMGKIVEAIVSVISAFNWLNLGANILKGLASGIKSMASSVTQAMQQGISGAISWIKSLPGQAVQWGKNLIQSFISGLNGTGTAATIATAGIQVAKTAAQPDTDWSLSDDVVDKAEVNAFRMQNLAKQVEDTIPAYTKSGNAAAAAAQKAGSAAKTAASVVNSYSDTAYEVVGNTKRTIQTINEELSNGTAQQKQTITSTSREMVDGVLKDIKTVETIAADGKRTVNQTMETVRDVVNTVTATTTALADGVKTTHPDRDQNSRGRHHRTAAGHHPDAGQGHRWGAPHGGDRQDHCRRRHRAGGRDHQGQRRQDTGRPLVYPQRPRQRGHPRHTVGSREERRLGGHRQVGGIRPLRRAHRRPEAEAHRLCPLAGRRPERRSRTGRTGAGAGRGFSGTAALRGHYRPLWRRCLSGRAAERHPAGHLRGS